MADDVVKINGLADTQLDKILNAKDAIKLRDDAELIEGVYGELPSEDYLAGKTAPVFFGSALNSFGIQELLDTFIEIAPNPLPRATTKRDVEPNEPKFSGFIFKIHANLDPKHRDRIAFLRVCSGKFERNKNFKHVRLEKQMKFANPYLFLAQSPTPVMWLVCTIPETSKLAILSPRAKASFSKEFQVFLRRFSRN
jgi:peptide chain release factor 3